MTCKWLIAMVIVSPLRIGLWDPFQMAELHGLKMGVILITYKSWDDPPSTPLLKVTPQKFSCRPATQSCYVNPIEPVDHHDVVSPWEIPHGL